MYGCLINYTLYNTEYIIRVALLAIQTVWYFCKTLWFFLTNCLKRTRAPRHFCVPIQHWWRVLHVLSVYLKIKQHHYNRQNTHQAASRPPRRSRHIIKQAADKFAVLPTTRVHYAYGAKYCWDNNRLYSYRCNHILNSNILPVYYTLKQHYNRQNNQQNH